MTDQEIKDKINPIVGYLFDSGRGAQMAGLPASADWKYLREGTRRIVALLAEMTTERDEARTALEVMHEVAHERDAARAELEEATRQEWQFGVAVMDFIQQKVSQVLPGELPMSSLRRSAR